MHKNALKNSKKHFPKVVHRANTFYHCTLHMDFEVLFALENRHLYLVLEDMHWEHLVVSNCSKVFHTILF